MKTPEFFAYEAYKQQRTTPQWLAHLRKLLTFPARFALGWKFRRRCLRGMGVRIGESYVGRDCMFDELGVDPDWQPGHDLVARHDCNA